MTSIDQGLARGKQRTVPFRSTGAPGFAIYGGYIVELEHDSRLAGTAKYRTFANILANTAIVAAGVRYFLNLIVKAGWRVEPADESAEAQKIADTVKDIMDDMTTPWHRVVRRAAMFKFYGFSVQEWTAKRREDGVIGFKDIEPRPQKTIEKWDTDESGTVLGIIQNSPQTGKEIYLPRGKCIYAVDDSLDDSPEGLGLFRHLASRADKLNRYELLEAWGFERDLRGTPIGRGPLKEMREQVTAGTLTEADVIQLKAPIETFIKNALKGVDTAIFLDSSVYRSIGEDETPINVPMWDVSLLQGSTTSQPEMAKAIERLNREMARILGVEQLLLGETSAGSYGLSKDKSAAFRLTVDSALNELVKTFEADFAVPLFELNAWDWKYFPSIKTDQIRTSDITEVTTALAEMARAGAPMVPDDPAVNEVRDLLGLSHAPEITLEMGLGLPMGAVPGTPGAPMAGQGEGEGEEGAMESEDQGKE